MHPYFFAPCDRQLFAVHHAPTDRRAEARGVVLCYPWGPEYVNSLRGCRQLSTRLARAGLHVLRFDHFGCGDSAGATEDADLERWAEDIGLAIDELKTRASVAAVSLVGVRLGATLAMMTALERRDVDALVLWAPIVNGARYLAELRARHAGFLRYESAQGRNQAPFSTQGESMGFPVPRTLADGLARIDLLALPPAPGRQVLVLGDGGEGAEAALVARLIQQGCQVEHLLPASQAIWLREPGQERALVPVPTLEAVAQWLTASPAAVSSRWSAPTGAGRPGMGA